VRIACGSSEVQAEQASVSCADKLRPMICVPTSKPLWQPSRGSASEFIVMMYWKPEAVARSAPSWSVLAPRRSSTIEEMAVMDG
jgi:hypothetical protein